MNILWVFGIVFVSLFAYLFFRKAQPEFSQLLPLAAAVLIFLFLLPQLEEIVTFVHALADQAGIPDSSVEVIFRGVGICLITRTASGFCVDCGQRALGDTVDYCGQIALVLLALPFLTQLAERLISGEFQ